jgi:peptidoglycan/xylan/chitin deacetylase (PgdA/CDA1 family)
MLDSHINKIKISFALLVILLLAGFWLATWGLQNSSLLSTRYLLINLKYLQHKIGYQIYSLNSPQVVYSNQSAGSVPVLLYHGILNKPDGSTGNFTKQQFRDHLFALKAAGYETVTIQDLYLYSLGQRDLPAKSFMITFDDGRKDSFYNADPLLKALDYTAVMTVISNTFGMNSQYYLAVADLKGMKRGGRWEIEAHTKDGHGFVPIDGEGNQGHFYSNKQWLPAVGRLETEDEFAERIRNDLLGVQQDMVKILGIEPVVFAFPFGDFGYDTENFPEAFAYVLKEVEKVYPISFYQIAPGVRYRANYPASLASQERDKPDHLMIKRVDLQNTLSPRDLLRLLEDSQKKTLPYQDDFFINEGWVIPWGEFVMNQNEAVLRAEEKGTGASAVLDGSGDWQDYTLKTTVSNPGPNGIYLGVRYQNDANHVACSFSREFVHIRQTVGGETKTIKGVIRNFVWPAEADFELEVQVKGRLVTCLLNGRPVVETEFLDRSLKQGGVMLKVWHPEPGEARATFREVAVSEL